MTEPRFHSCQSPLDLAALVELTGARPAGEAARRPLAITGVGTLAWAGPSDVACADPEAGGDEAAEVGRTDAGVCIVPPGLESFVPAHSVALVSAHPREAFEAVAVALFPAAGKPAAMFGAGVASGAAVHPGARLEPDVSVDPGAVVGPDVEIGRGAVIGANAVLGAGVRIGRDSRIGAGAQLANALVGDRVVIGAGAALGFPGLGEAAAPGRKAQPSLGRVVIQDDVVIGANAAIACGRARDTIIGEASRVDAMTRIAPDVVVGRHCLVHALAPLREGETTGDHMICGLDDDRRRQPLKDNDA